jgi:sec-independent protein translocase protein TatB
MIDIGLTKLALIGVVALVVVGPERLPKVARMAGTLFGRAQRYLSDIKSEVSREIEIEELRKMQKDVTEAASSVERDWYQNVSKTTSDINAAYSGSESEPSIVNDAGRKMPTPAAQQIKAKNFRKKRLSRTSAIPSWYKQQNGQKVRVISAAARVARYRPTTAPKSGGFFN